MKTTLHIIDEINCHFTGLKDRHITEIIERTKLPIKGAFHTAAYQMKLTDGKESQFDESGLTFIYMLDKVLPLINKWGYEVEVIDDRSQLIHIKEIIDEFFLCIDGNFLRPYQVTSINNAIEHEHGIVNIPTSGGKTYICAALSKYYDSYFGMIVIVPTEKLVNQTYNDMIKAGLDVGKINKSYSNKRREEEWNKRHVVCTWQILKNNKQRCVRFNGFVYDETHHMGDVMYGILSNELAHAQIRIGMTGTVPKDRNKKEKICCHIGNDVIHKVTAKELQDDGYISTLDIQMIPIRHNFELPDDVEWDWDYEESYLLSNRDRIDVLIKFIQKLSSENTLILTHKKLARKLARKLDFDYIDGDTDEKTREEYYTEFTKQDEYHLIATYETVGTGISINEIRRMILIDGGKNEIRILQGIGRGLRKEEENSHLKVYDLYSEIYTVNSEGKEVDYSYSGTKHLRLRKKIYKDEHYPFVIMGGIEV